MTVGLDQIIALNKIYIKKGMISKKDDAALENGAFFDKVYRLLKAVHAGAARRCVQDAAGGKATVIYDAKRYTVKEIAEKAARRN